MSDYHVAPRVVSALMFDIRSELDRVYGNVNQRRWRNDECGCPSAPLGIEGMKWEQPSPDDDMDCSGSFTFDGVTVGWYKWLGRGMSSDAERTPAEWVAWFDRVIDACDLFEERGHEIPAEEANQPGSADRQCSKCQRWFSYPSRRCGFDGTPHDGGA